MADDEQHGEVELARGERYTVSAGLDDQMKYSGALLGNSSFWSVGFWLD